MVMGPLTLSSTTVKLIFFHSHSLLTFSFFKQLSSSYNNLELLQFSVMSGFILSLLVFLAISAHASATYCVCKDGGSDAVYQKNIDYACSKGADCTPIQQNGACYSPNTVKDHCNYAVNSYFQKQGQATGSCDFSSTATTTASLPGPQSSTCVYPSSASSTGTTPTSPSTGTTTPTTPTTGTSTPTTPGIGTTSPSTGTTSPGTGTTTPSTGTAFNSPPSSVFGLGPSSINPSTDTSKAHSKKPLIWAFALFSAPFLLLSI